MNQDRSSHRLTTVYRHITRGVAWGVTMRWSIRAIGLINTMILARLLTPEDFGVVAVAMLVYGFLQIMTEMGTPLLLIRDPETIRSRCDTAWTVRIFQGLATAIVVSLIAPYAAKYFGDPRVVDVMYVLAAVAIFAGFENIGIVLIRKELDFARDFRFGVYKRVISFFITVGLAFALRSYWALVLGTLLGRIMGVVLSYSIHPYRPRINFSHFREFMKFAGSVMPFKVGRHLQLKFHVIVVGGISTTAQLGIYNVASELSTMLTSEITGPIGRALYPNYAKLIDKPDQLAEAFRNVLATVSGLTIPLGVALSLFASDAVQIILGSQWTDAVYFVQWLSIAGPAYGLIHIMSGNIFIVIGKERMAMLLMWMRLAVLIPAVTIAGNLWGVRAVPPTMLVTALTVIPVIAYFLSKSIEISPRQIASSIFRPVVAAIIMAMAVVALRKFTDSLGFFGLLTELLAGGLVYAASVYTLWLLAGRPNSVEAAIIGFIATKLRLKSNAP